MKKDNCAILSVCLITYNHEKYIREAIEGVLMQKANFDFELIIGEDCSTDRTREICILFKEKYPDKIKLLLNEKNIGMLPNFIRTLNACTGRYIALCEGDDYWTDPYKLQKQVDFLEANDDFSLCFHPAIVVNKYGEKTDTFDRMEKEVLLLEDIIREVKHVIPTASILFRNCLPQQFYDFITNNPFIISGDQCLHLFAASIGKIKKLNEPMCAWRSHTGGISNYGDYYKIFKSDAELYSKIKNDIPCHLHSLLSDKVFVRRLQASEVLLKRKRRIEGFIYLLLTIKYVNRKNRKEYLTQIESYVYSVKVFYFIRKGLRFTMRGFKRNIRKTES